MLNHPLNDSGVATPVGLKARGRAGRRRAQLATLVASRAGFCARRGPGMAPDEPGASRVLRLSTLPQGPTPSLALGEELGRETQSVPRASVQAPLFSKSPAGVSGSLPGPAGVTSGPARVSWVTSGPAGVSRVTSGSRRGLLGHFRVPPEPVRHFREGPLASPHFEETIECRLWLWGSLQGAGFPSANAQCSSYPWERGRIFWKHSHFEASALVQASEPLHGTRGEVTRATLHLDDECCSVNPFSVSNCTREASSGKNVGRCRRRSGVQDGWSTSWKVIVSNVLHLVH